MSTAHAANKPAQTPTSITPKIFQVIGNVLLWWATLILCAASILSYYSSSLMIGNVFALGLDIYFYIALILTAVFFVLGKHRLLLVTLITIGMCMTQFMAYQPAKIRDSATPQLRVMSYNLYYDNQQLPAVVQEVSSAEADVVFLMEYSDSVAQEIGSSFAEYPYQIEKTSSITMGVLLLSKFPILHSKIHQADDTRIPIIEAMIEVDSVPLTIVAAHPWSQTPDWLELHQDQVRAVTEVAAQASQPLMVMGDFNESQWSGMMQELETTARVRNVRPRFDFSNTWTYVPGIGLPMDHIYISDDMQVNRFFYGDAAGSDHVPLIVDVSLPIAE